MSKKVDKPAFDATLRGLEIDAERISGPRKGASVGLVQVPMAQPQRELEAPAVEPAFRVLVAVARPLDVRELPDIADQWELVKGLSTVEAPAELVVLRPPTVEALRTEAQRGYDIFHFDGHGLFAWPCPRCGHLNPKTEDGSDPEICIACGSSLTGVDPSGYLAFEHEDGTANLLPADELAEMLAAVHIRPIRLVILSACQSAMGEEHSLAATLLKHGVPAVLAMQETVPLSLTLALTGPFYAALGAGKTIQEAFETALPTLRWHPPMVRTGTPAVDVPRLIGYGLGERLVEPGAPRGPIWMRGERIVGLEDERHFYGIFIPTDPPRGRKGLLTQIARALLEGESPVVLTGTGGIGKTVLAKVAARRLSWRFPGGVFWRSAADYETFRLDDLLDAFAAVFGERFYTLPLPAKRDLVLGYLRDLRTPALIVLDNAEVVKDEAVHRFLTGLPAPSAALVTSREAPEWGGYVIDIRAMEAQEGVDFFLEEVRRVKRDPLWGWRLTDDGKLQWVLSEADTKALSEICRLLEGHPLALMLAAALLRTQGLSEVLAQVRANPARGELERRFDFSYKTLSDSEQDLLHRLAAFSSHVGAWAIENVCINDKLVGNDVLPSWRSDLIQLVRKTFVEMLEFAGIDQEGNEVTVHRYRLHPVMRQYAAGKAGPKTMQAHNRRAAQLFLAYAQQFKDDFDALEQERLNILGGMDWAYEAGEWDIVTRIMWATMAYLYTRGYWNEYKIRLGQALKAAGKINDFHSEGAFVNSRAIVLSAQGDLDGARKEYQQALKIARKHGYKQGEAATLHQLGMLGATTPRPGGSTSKA